MVHWLSGPFNCWPFFGHPGHIFGQFLGLELGAGGCFWHECSPSIAEWSPNVASWCPERKKMIRKTKHIWVKIVKRILRADVLEGLIEISRWSAEKNHQDPTNCCRVIGWKPFPHWKWQSLNSRLNTCVIIMTLKTSAIFWVYICWPFGPPYDCINNEASMILDINDKNV